MDANIGSQQDNPLKCPVVETMGLISGKWKPMILHALGQQDFRFGELKREMFPISQKVLTQQLKELEADGLLGRDVEEGNVLSVTYRLTALGESLNPVLSALYDWGSALDRQSA